MSGLGFVGNLQWDQKGHGRTRRLMLWTGGWHVEVYFETDPLPGLMFWDDDPRVTNDHTKKVAVRSTAIALTDLLRAGTAGALVDENRRLRAERCSLCVFQALTGVKPSLKGTR